MRSYWSRRNDYFFLESGVGGRGVGQENRILPTMMRISIYFPCIFDRFSKSSRVVEVIWDLVYPGRGRTATCLCGNVQVFQQKGPRQVLLNICLTLCWLKWQYFISHCSFSRQYTTIHSCMGRQQVLWDVAPEKGWFWQQLLPMKKWLEFGLCQPGLSQVEQLAREKGIAGNLSGLCGYCVLFLCFESTVYYDFNFGGAFFP